MPQRALVSAVVCISLGKNNDVCVGLPSSEDPRHVHAWWRRADVLVRCVRGVEHEVRRSLHNLVVHEERSAVRKHIDDSRLARSFEFTLLVAVIDFRFDFTFGLALSPFLFREQSSGKRSDTPFRVKASGLAVPWRLAVHETGESVASFTNFYVPAMFQYINRSFA